MTSEEEDKKSGAAFYTIDEAGRPQDAGLHAELLDNPELEARSARETIQLATDQGMTLASAVRLYGTEDMRAAFEQDGTDPRESVSKS